MNTSIKEKVLAHISRSHDDQLMLDIARLIEIDSDDNAEEFLTESDRKKLQLSLNQVENNLTISAAKADNEIDEWLEK